LSPGISFHRFARLELRDAVDFYEEEDPGLGRAFLAIVEAGLLTRVGEAGSGAAFKRLGFLSERLLDGEEVLVKEAFARRTTGVVRLNPGVPTRGRLSARWRRWVNVTIQEEGPNS